MHVQANDSILGEGKQASPFVASELSHQLYTLLVPLLRQLDELLDKRLVRTFFTALQVIVQLRHRSYGLLLSELGGYILGPDQAPAGTKRLSNLLRSPRWQYRLIEQFLWQGAAERIKELAAQGEDALVMWDESELEKAESIRVEGLCAVRSSKAARLKRIKPGYYNPPGGPPVFVPGMHWLSLLVVGRNHESGPPCAAAMRWWTSRGKWASDKSTQRQQLLSQSAQAWGQEVVHVFDRGFAGAPWLTLLFGHTVRFVMRWPKGNKLMDEHGIEMVEKKAWEITRGKPSRQYRQVWDSTRRCYRKTGVVVVRVRHPQYLAPLWLVVSRPGKGREPWYLLTNEPVLRVGDAWRIVFAYARRWQIEMSFRFHKSELAMESPRLWSWENRLKLLGMVALVYAFLLTLLDVSHALLREWLLRWWCHRNGKRNRDASVPLYRLRSALSRLWLAHRPSPLAFPLQTPG